MNYNEKHLLKQFENKSKFDFELFKDDNNPNNFSDEFHSKFDELYSQVCYDQGIKKDLEKEIENQ